MGQYLRGVETTREVLSSQSHTLAQLPREERENEGFCPGNERGDWKPGGLLGPTGSPRKNLLFKSKLDKSFPLFQCSSKFSTYFQIILRTELLEYQFFCIFVLIFGCPVTEWP